MQRIASEIYVKDQKIFQHFTLNTQHIVLKSLLMSCCCGGIRAYISNLLDIIPHIYEVC